MNSPSLHSLHGQVHRFNGVIDSFGGFPQSGRIIHTLCVRELRLASKDQPVHPDHWWFRLREGWAQAAIETDGPVRRRHQVTGFGGRIRDVVVTHRAQRHSVVLNDLQEQVRRQALLLAEAADQARRLEIHRDALLHDVQELPDRLRLISTRCRILDPSATRTLPAKPKRATEGQQRRSFFAREPVHNGAGFASLSR